MKTFLERQAEAVGAAEDIMVRAFMAQGVAEGKAIALIDSEVEILLGADGQVFRVTACGYQGSGSHQDLVNLAKVLHLQHRSRLGGAPVSFGGSPSGINRVSTRQPVDSGYIARELREAF